MLPDPPGGFRPRNERLLEFYRRMQEAELASTFSEAYKLLCGTLDAVEDEFSGLPNEPSRHRELERNFPPQMDRMVSVPACPDVKRFDSTKHWTYIAGNGAIEIRRKDPAVRIEFSKLGSDKRSISEVCPQLLENNF